MALELSNAWDKNDRMRIHDLAVEPNAGYVAK